MKGPRCQHVQKGQHVQNDFKFKKKKKKKEYTQYIKVLLSK